MKRERVNPYRVFDKVATAWEAAGRPSTQKWYQVMLKAAAIMQRDVQCGRYFDFQAVADRADQCLAWAQDILWDLRRACPK